MLTDVCIFYVYDENHIQGHNMTSPGRVSFAEKSVYGFS